MSVAPAATDAEDDAWVILLFNKKLKMCFDFGAKMKT